jgi:mannonate dehydratase
MLSRRSLLKLGLASAASPLLAIDEHAASNTKICHRLVAKSITDDDLLFLKQIGLRWARVEFGPEEGSFEHIRATQQRFAKFGIRIDRYRAFLRDTGKLEIPVSSYDFHPANTYTTKTVERRGYLAREFDLADFRARVEKQAFEREYSADDIWANYTYFMKAVLPAAEEAKVKLALHPDDPPVAKMNGVAKIFTHYDGYHRAEQIAGGSKYWGLTFCVGTWSEGGDKMGKNVFEMIRDFGGRGKLLEVHFRNVSGPMPHFVETFPDDGYMDMYQVMKALRQVHFDGAAEPDHVPQLAGDTGLHRAGTAYIISYMRALLRRANEEAG